MRRSRALLLAGALAAQTAASAHAAAAPTPVIVELFTSEGCSSCPPADRLLMDLLATQPVSGALVVGLSEHVDYWNRLGWKDPFSSAAFSERQAGYAARRRGGEVFTPQVIVDGGDAFVGSDRHAALAAITGAVAQPKAPIRLGWTAGAGSSLLVEIADATVAGATVWLAVTEDGLASDVTRGENGGHRLEHAAVTRQLTAIGHADRAGRFEATRSLTLDRAWRRSALHVVVFAQPDRLTRVVAAGTIDLR